MGYDPKRSALKDDRLIDFIRAPITGDLLEVPGIGDAAVEAMAKMEGNDPSTCVTTTFQLIGKFISLKGTDSSGDMIDVKEHTDRFWFWLKDNKKINACRGMIVRAIAEKVNSMMPGMYDESLYEE